MKCRTAERWMHRRHDGLLSQEETERLESHLRSCPECREKEKSYAALFGALGRLDVPPPRPLFWQRLEARMAVRERENGWAFVRVCCQRAVPAALVLMGLILAAILALSPGQEKELSSSETLLLQNVNPLMETRTLLEETQLENKNIMLIFASADEYALPRREAP